RLRIVLATLPAQNLREAREGFRISWIGFQNATPRPLAALQLTSPTDHPRQALCRRRISGSRELGVHRLGLTQLAVPRQSPRVIHSCVTIGGVIADPHLVDSKGFTQASRPGEGLCATHRSVARALIGYNQS